MFPLYILNILYQKLFGIRPNECAARNDKRLLSRTYNSMKMHLFGYCKCKTQPDRSTKMPIKNGSTMVIWANGFVLSFARYRAPLFIDNHSNFTLSSFTWFFCATSISLSWPCFKAELIFISWASHKISII